jgi:hypothetical protein
LVGWTRASLVTVDVVEWIYLVGVVFGITSHDAGKADYKEGTIQPALVRLKSIGNDEPISVEFMTAYSPRPVEYSMKAERMMASSERPIASCEGGYERLSSPPKKFCSISADI